MDYGLACHRKSSNLDGSFLVSNEPKDDKGHGSGHLKHQRSDLAEDNNNNGNNMWRLSKMPRPGEVDFSSRKAAESLISTPFGRSIVWPPADDAAGQKMLSFSSGEPHCSGGSGRSIAFSIYQDEHHSRAGGFGLIGGGRGPFAKLKGPFTPSQWMELEHQALIYKHIVANVPVPSNLLVPLKRSLYSITLPATYAPNLLGWGPFHLGISGSNDPEPGRCRRTDGKKWRCSRDAVPDQKYCERHINRGRHRSRKPVEGQNNGHTLSQPQPTTASKPLLPLPTNAPISTDYLISRPQEFQGLSLIPPTTTLKPKQQQEFPFQKDHLTFEEPSDSKFGVISSNFMDCPKDQSQRATSAPWHEPLKPDWTQLSMSIPMADPGFPCSPARAKTSPFLGGPHELDPIVHMGLGVGRDLDGPVHKEQQQPIAWGNQLGGPLGEVLSWQLSGSSPTGVLQKSTFVSLSNSSSGSGSSPRSSWDQKKGLTDNGSLCNDVFGSALLSSAASQTLR
ncbi:Growth-regulating factor 1 [Striga hermonthica]|uniref:Growth-regulating factor n=1 Tax=Striga hermonthica TaxID=68872 RepID=A0A9N7NP50_STRHE|nr:Growth-regulating factor 1 [Striga hermonthica]